MTSVTISSTTGPLHGGYSSVREDLTRGEQEFEAPRSVKRSLNIHSTDPCKKRRKQSTPIRISTSELEQEPVSNSLEGKQTSSSPDSALECPKCHLNFETIEQVQDHGSCDHPPIECKKEPEEIRETPALTPYVERSETPMSLTMARQEVPWMNDIQSKEWMNANMPNLPFNPANPVFMAMNQFSQMENIPMKPIRIFNPEAYCELCNKEFCNKYFLKTHKANKHGIYTDTPTSEQLPNTATIPPFAGNLKIPTSVPSVDLSIKNETKTSANLINLYSDIMHNPFSKFPRQTVPVLPDSEPNENISAPVATPSGPLSASDSDKVPMTDDQTAEECSSSSITQTEPTSLKTESDGMHYDTRMSPGQYGRDLDPNRFRRIGVMNPKAFCEICCKEYCNKYFLRTHKMKRHGICIPDDRDLKMEGFSWPSNVQTSPLNLIMTEQTNIHDRKTTSPNDISCDTCGIRFQNASLAQLHNFTVHGRIYSKDHQENINEESKQTPELSKPSDKTEAISEDLKKLQTMILQLNDLDVNKASTTCTTCNKEFENKFYLHAHMVSEHCVLLEEATETEKTTESENSNNNTLCDLCGKDVQSAEEMKKHILEYHSVTQENSNTKEEYIEFNAPEKLTNRIPPATTSVPERRLNVTPTSSYCEICNKELCNKYFMKTHMQRMHGIEIENGAQIGGVVCDICNKELCSKYFLRVHKHNTHGIVEYGASLMPPRKPDSETTPSSSSTMLPENDPALKPGDLADLSHRYFTHFTEVCPICSRRFRSTKWLKAHLVTDHGQSGAEKWNEIEQQLQHTLGQNSKSSTAVKIERASPNLKVPNGSQDMQGKGKVGMQNVLSSLFGVEDANAKSYNCAYCPFTTPLLPLLFVHERSHSVQPNGDQMPFKCAVCPMSFMQRDLLQRHLYTQHAFLPLFNGNTNNSEMPRESQENIDETETATETKFEESGSSLDQGSCKIVKNKKPPTPKLKRVELPSEITQALKDLAKKSQLPATYALPQGQNQGHEPGREESAAPGYVMQAFLLEESTPDRRVVPSVVFLPMLRKQPAPLKLTFTLTPA